MHRYSASIFLLVFAVLLTFSQSPSFANTQALIKPAPYARHLTVLDGLNLGEVNIVFQGQNGYIWLGTNEGLIRFDGLNAKRFSHNPNDPYSLNHNRVFGITQDDSGTLWLSTYGGGLSKFSIKTGQFSAMDLRLTSNGRANTEQLYNVTLGKNNVLWVGSDKGLLLFDTTTEKALGLPKTLETLPKEITSKVFIDSHENHWIISIYHGLYRYANNRLHQFEYDNSATDKLDSPLLRNLYQDNDGKLWVSTQSALHLYNREQNSFTRFRPSDNPQLDDFNNDIYAIADDGNGRLWMGAANGVHYFDKRNRQFHPITGPLDLNKQFRQNRLNKIFKDKDGSLWFASQNGVIYLPVGALRFDYLSNPTATLKITDIENLDQDNVALAGGFKLFAANLDNFVVTQHLPDQSVRYRITKDLDSNWWITTIGNSLQQYSPQNGQLKPVLQHQFISSDSITRGLFDVVVDNQNNPWLLPFPDPPHFNGGVLRYYPDTDKSTHILKNTTASDLIQFNDKQLLYSSLDQGLYLIDIDSMKTQRWAPDITNPPQRSNTLFKDSRGTLWIGTSAQGLGRYNAKTRSMIYYTTADGMLTNNIISIIEDDQNQLWLGTAVGLNRLNPGNEQIISIEKQDGLLFSSFRKRTAIKRDNGRLVMGTKSGLVQFDPKGFDSPKGSPKVIIDDFKLFNQSVELSKPGQPTVLSKPVAFTQHLTLSHRDYVFSFGFSATEYLRPDKIKFAYQMAGLDDKWVYTDADNRIATYTTLPSGDYEFKVRASNSSGEWSVGHTSIKVTIQPPWWLTWQAYLVYLTVLVSALWLYIQKRTNKLTQQAQQLERSVRERTTELQQSRDQLAQQSQTVSDLLEQKQQLFASVSHEFRTPLTLILSPVEQMQIRFADSPIEKAIGKDLALVKRSARRLLRMVDQLLEFAKLEQHHDSKSETVSLAQTINLIAASFDPLLKTRELSLQIAPFDDVFVQVLPDSLNKIVINLLSNAIKYTTEQGQITVTVTVIDDNVSINISDTGIGIAKADQQTIFQRFNRATHDHGESIPGAGIGLALVKELVEANDGNISLNSVLGQGSTFMVTLPVFDAVDSAQIDAESALAQTSQTLDPSLEIELDSITSTTDNEQSATAQTQQSQLKTVLIIDDNADMRQLLNNQLSNIYHCLQAANGQIGLTLAKEHMPDLVISDVMMPIMDGYELTQALKSDQLTSHIPVILLTAKGSVQSRIKGLQLLVDDYLAKPFNLEELLLRINNILTIRDILRKRYGQAIDTSHSNAQLSELGMSEPDQQFFEQINQHLETHYQDTGFNLKQLCELMFISDKQLQRKTKAVFDLRFPEMVRNFRLDKAIKLLDAGHRVSNVFYEVGFSSHSYFSLCFKAKYGKNPKAYQQSRENAND